MIVLVLTTMSSWYSHILDVNGAFLLGNYEHGEKIYMEVPQGFEPYYGQNVVLFLLHTLYGTIQAAIMFWKVLVRAFWALSYKRSNADPCLYYHWNQDSKLVLWTSWVDDLLVCGAKEDVLQEVEKMKTKFKCDNGGPLKEYIGCKIEYVPEDNWMKLTQPVLLQSFEDEFDIKNAKFSSTPAAPNSMLDEDEGQPHVSESKKSLYQKGVGKLLYLMKWSRPEILNSV